MLFVLSPDSLLSSVTNQDGRTMLDYALIAKSKGRFWNQLDATIAFLQAETG
jgi:hypothetical protein